MALPSIPTGNDKEVLDFYLVASLYDVMRVCKEKENINSTCFVYGQEKLNN